MIIFDYGIKLFESIDSSQIIYLTKSPQIYINLIWFFKSWLKKNKSFKESCCQN